MSFKKSILFSLAAAFPLIAHATAPDSQMPSAAVNAHVSMEVPQDQVSAALYVEDTGNDRTALISEVNLALQHALAVAKSSPAVTLKTSGYRSYPLYDKNQHVSGYRVRADLTLESKDFDAFSKTFTTLSSTLSVQDVSYSISDQALKTAKTKLLAEVAAEFRTEATSITHAFGFTSYDIKELNVNYDSEVRQPMPMRVMAVAKTPVAQVPASIEPGTSAVSANAIGTVALH